MDSSSDKSNIRTELYEDQNKQHWPKVGRHILAHYDDESIVVYQAFCPEIADYAVINGKFGGPNYSFSRMSWIKTNFLWMMYRAGWATKKNQDRILAIFLKREGFDEILRSAREGNAPPGTSDHGKGPDEVRLQWDPDHHPSGAKLERRAIQLGLRGQILTRFNQEWLLRIEDVTEFVKEQHGVFTAGFIENLMTPRERVYVPSDVEVCRHIRLTGFVDEMNSLESPKEGACCQAMLDGNNKEPGNNSSAVTSRGVIICLGGAFNPVHTKHVQCMIETKKWLEEYTEFRVIAGVFAVAPDGYVRSKCRKTNQKCIKPEHRIKMCELACKGYDWLITFGKPTGSANQGGKEYIRNNGLRNVRLVVIVGADRAVNAAGKAKWHSKNDVITVCIGRQGETQQVQQAFATDQQLGRMKNDNFYILSKELDNVSSTEIRKRLVFDDVTGDEEKQRIVGEMVERGWLHAEVGQHILQNEADLYVQ